VAGLVRTLTVRLLDLPKGIFTLTDAFCPSRGTRLSERCRLCRIRCLGGSSGVFDVEVPERGVGTRLTDMYIEYLTVCSCSYLSIS